MREAWEIDENDPDIVILDLEDPPIIPSGKKDVPANRALALLAKRKSSRRDQ